MISYSTTIVRTSVGGFYNYVIFVVKGPNNRGKQWIGIFVFADFALLDVCFDYFCLVLHSQRGYNALHKFVIQIRMQQPKAGTNWVEMLFNSNIQPSIKNGKLSMLKASWKKSCYASWNETRQKRNLMGCK